MPFLLLALCVSLYADLADYVLSPIPFSLYPERMAPLLAEGPLCDGSFSLEYENLYDYRNENEKLSDSSFGPVEEKAAGFRASSSAFCRLKYLRLGLTGVSGGLSGLIEKGPTGDEQYRLDHDASTFMAHGAAVVGPGVLGGGIDPDNRHRYFFLRVKWKRAYGLYAFETDRECFSATLRPASLTKSIEFDIMKKAGHYEAGVDLPLARLSLFYGPVSLLNDSSLQSENNMSSLLFLSGEKAGLSLDSPALPFQPRLSYRTLDLSGYCQGFFNRIKFGALDEIHVFMQQADGDILLPLGIRAGASYRKITASGTKGYLEASPFNVWNFFTHTYYKLRDPGAWCVEKSVFAGRVFRLQRLKLEADLTVAYDVIDFDSRFFYKEREMLTLFGPFGWPHYGPEKERVPAEGSEDFLYFKARLSRSFSRAEVSLSGSQYVPVPEGKKGGGGPSMETSPKVSGGSGLEFSVHFWL
jgi:hypothetical protein